ncbi:MAG: hypothetical protein KatS3mg008_0018 [Acidimicrobiales bacterium]|nr:MAG: hypothetical protein KatS3mg008_0018 [Acidimicrobiales bacterium]
MNARGGLRGIKGDELVGVGVPTTKRRLAAGIPLLVEAYRFLRSPRAQLDVERDLRTTRRRTRFLRRITTPPRSRTALAVCLSEEPWEIKMVLASAAALRLRGWRVVVLGRSDAASRLRRYAAAFGVDDFVGYDRFTPTGAEKAELEARAERLVRDAASFQEAVGWEFEGSSVGVHALSSVSRRLLEGNPDPTDPAVRADLRAVLPEAFFSVRRAARLLDAVNPDLVVIGETNYVVRGPLVDVAVERGVKVAQVQRLWREDALMSRVVNSTTRRTHPAALSAETLERLAAGPWTDAHEQVLRREFSDRYGGVYEMQQAYQAEGVRRYDKASFRSALGIRPGRKVVVIFSHVLWDANLFYGEDLFDNFGVWLVETLRVACRNDTVDWVLKVHPANLWKRRFHGSDRLNELELIAEHVGELPPHVHLLMPDTDVSTISVYEHADVGVTVRGTPGMEMPCFGKPVLTAGTGRYSGLGFTVDSSTREEYLGRLETVADLEELDESQVARAKWHALGVFRLRQMPLRTLRPTRIAGGDGVRDDFVWTPSSPEEFRECGDFDLWVEWVEEGATWEYLHPDPSIWPEGSGASRREVRVEGG